MNRQQVNRHKYLNLSWFRITLILLLLIFSFLSLSTGVQNFSFLGFLTGNSDDSFIALVSRIPRTLSIIITGAGLSMAGLIMQTITNNKFVSPSTAGTMEWCRLGVCISILFAAGRNTMSKVLLAFVISLLGTFLFMTLLQRIKLKNAFIVPLVGMMMGNVVSAITTFFAYKYDIIQNISSWLQGNFSLIIKGNYEILYLGIPCLIITYLYAHKFTIAGMGESFATSLGLKHKQVVMIGLVIVAFMTSLIVVTIGSISFVGLIIPNLISMFRGDNLKGTLLDTSILGAVFVLLCDLIGRTLIYPYEINVSVVISVIGSLVFVAILFKKHR